VALTRLKAAKRGKRGNKSVTQPLLRGNCLLQPLSSGTQSSSIHLAVLLDSHGKIQPIQGDQNREVEKIYHINLSTKVQPLRCSPMHLTGHLDLLHHASKSS
jgi:hypothetical protein